MPAVIPLVATGISAGVGAWNSHKQRQAAEKARKANQPLMDASSGIARGQAAQGTALTAQGQQTLGGPTDYYTKLLHGDRAQLSEAVAPESRAIGEVYRGAERGLERSGAQGAQRDVAQANLSRDRAGKIAGLYSGVRQGAASALTNIGQFGINAGQAASGQAASIYAQLLNGMNATRDMNMKEQKYGDERSDALWKNVGGLLVDSYGAYDKWKKGKAPTNANASVYGG